VNVDPSLWGSYAGTFADWEKEGVTEPYYQTPDGKVTLYHGHVLDVLREMPTESVNCVCTSPPYWSLRKYDCEPVIWGGDPNCPHTLEAQPVEGESYEGKARWQHDGVSRQETPEAWVKATTRGAKGNTIDSNVSAAKKEAISPQETATCRLCGAWRGQYGLEPTPELYVEHTLMWLREVRRVLRPDGTLWLNMGDGYASGSSGHAGESQLDGGEPSGSRSLGRIKPPGNGLKPKDAVLMPFRVALAAQADGWWVRSVIIWAKPNPMPESVRDRPTDAHEYVFLLTKSKTYFYDAEAVKEAGSPNTHRRAPVGQVSRPPSESPEGIAERGRLGVFTDGRQYDYEPGDSRNLRSVWSFPTQGFPDAHFAVFPRELPERCIKAGCPEWVCPKCGKARVRVTETALTVHDGKTASAYPKGTTANRLALLRQAARERGGEYVNERATLAWTDCGCGAGFIGGVVLDPFVGSGTTCEVAYHLGRQAIGIDASAKYLDMAIGRVKQGALL
jgi:DNA modification methylase